MKATRLQKRLCALSLRKGEPASKFGFELSGGFYFDLLTEEWYSEADLQAARKACRGSKKRERKRKYHEGDLPGHKVYFAEVGNNPFNRLYKVGITSGSLNARWCADADVDLITITHVEIYATREEAQARETELKQRYREHRYDGPDVLTSGNSELYTYNPVRDLT
jgi:hypothetical protein